MKLQKNVLNQSLIDIKMIYKNQLSVVSLSSIMFIYLFIYYKCHKINPDCGGSYIDSPDWIKNKKHQ